MRDRLVKAAVLTIPLEDAELVEQCRNGNLTAFGRLVTKHQDHVLNTCWRVCGDRQEAEDLTQEAFIRAFESIGQFAGRSRFSTWVYRIALNLAISARRKDRHRRTHSLDEARCRQEDEPQRPAIERLASSEPAPQDRLFSREEGRGVLAALERLDDESRAVIVLRDVEDLSYDEIAEILDVPNGTVKSRLHRARLALRDQLAKPGDTA